MTATGNPALDAGEDSLQDSDLLASLRAGEDAAFGELFSRHADAVRRLARSLATDRADAEDLTAEAFFRVLQAIRRGSGPNDNVRSYLLIVTRRVAWEWRERRRDVPDSDEILTHRVGPNPDISSQAHERSLIARAFTSLPERWRSVLWKVEVEGERPAVVALNFGLSPNATAALARRARRGLRAAYLQAHLSTHRGSSGCRSVLEKLGAYTAGTIKGAERRRVRAHLVTCSSCQSTHDELVDVCAGLRSYAGIAAAPVMVGVLVHKTGLGAMLKGLLSSAGAKLSLAASSVLAAGVLGVVSGSSDAPPLAALDFNGGSGELSITQSEVSHPAPVIGSLSSSVPSTPGRAQPVIDKKKNIPGRPVNPPDDAAVAVENQQQETTAPPVENTQRDDAPAGQIEETTIQLATPKSNQNNNPIAEQQPTTCIGAEESVPAKTSDQPSEKSTAAVESTSAPTKTPETSTSASPEPPK